MKDKTQDIDALFAGECDGELCGAIYHVLHEKEAIMMELNFDDWPASWVNHWSVWKHYWIWKVDGFESLWTVDVEQLVQFQNCLIEIGDQGASEFFAESMQAVGLDRIGTHALAFSDDIHQLADDWDKEAVLPWRKIEICLAKHSRSRRLDFLPLYDRLVSRLANDRQIYSKR
jgi:hypothetical protein